MALQAGINVQAVEGHEAKPIWLSPYKKEDGMITLRKRPRKMKVLAMGRQGRTVHDELVDEIGPVPTVFEEQFPFEWPVSELLTMTKEEQAATYIAATGSDDELVEFWEGIAKQEKRGKGRNT